MKIINRDLFYITPKQALFDWYLKSFPDDPVFSNEADFHDHASIYLIPEFEDSWEALQWMEKDWEQWFATLFELWCTDESLWPRDRNWKLLNDFFAITYQSLIFDTVRLPIRKDD